MESCEKKVPETLKITDLNGNIKNYDISEFKSFDHLVVSFAVEAKTVASCIIFVYAATGEIVVQNEGMTSPRNTLERFNGKHLYTINRTTTMEDKMKRWCAEEWKSIIQIHEKWGDHLVLRRILSFLGRYSLEKKKQIATELWKCTFNDLRTNEVQADDTNAIARRLQILADDHETYGGQINVNMFHNAHVRRTLLHRAALVGSIKIVTVLLELQMDPNLGDLMGRKPLHLASSNFQEDCMLALIRGDADLNICDHRGDTPLHVAAQYGQREACDRLIKWGADPTIQNLQYLTALERARRWGRYNQVKDVFDETLSPRSTDEKALDFSPREHQNPLLIPLLGWFRQIIVRYACCER